MALVASFSLDKVVKEALRESRLINLQTVVVREKYERRKKI